jgi:hypothetical protein
MASLNKCRSKNVLNKSNKLHELTLCAIIVFNMILNDYLISVPHTLQLSLSLATNFKHRFNHKDQGGVSRSAKGCLLHTTRHTTAGLLLKLSRVGPGQFLDGRHSFLWSEKKYPNAR